MEKTDAKNTALGCTTHKEKWTIIRTPQQWYIHTHSFGFKSCSQLLKHPASAIQVATVLYVIPVSFGVGYCSFHSYIPLPL